MDIPASRSHDIPPAAVPCITPERILAESQVSYHYLHEGYVSLLHFIITLSEEDSFTLLFYKLLYYSRDFLLVSEKHLFTFGASCFLVVFFYFLLVLVLVARVCMCCHRSR